MTNQYRFEVVEIVVQDTSQAPIAEDLFYKCLICESMIPSMPDDNIRCQCRNVVIDVDMHRLYIGDYQKFAVLKRMKV